MFRMEVADQAAIGHIGNTPGYSGLMAYFPQKQLYLVILLNQNYLRAENGQVNIEIMAENIIESLPGG